MMADPVKHVKILAKFLGVPFTGEEEEGGIPEEVVRLCSFEKLNGLQANQEDIVRLENVVSLEKSVFFRKGKVGDWVNHISKDIGRKLHYYRNRHQHRLMKGISTGFRVVNLASVVNL
ncbi:hypothetical protein ACP4OV_005479 [Aristida adscensionis]